MPKISREGIIGLLLEIALGILDHLHVRDPVIIWMLFFLGLGLISDSIIRSNWAVKKRWVGMAFVAVLFLVFGIWIHGRNRNPSERTGLLPTAPLSAPTTPIEPALPKEQAKPLPDSAPKSDQTIDNPNIGSITTGPCSNVQIGGTNNNQEGNCGPMPPKIKWDEMSANVPDNGFFKTEFKLVIDTKQAFLLHVKATSQNIVGSFTIDDQRPPGQGGKAFSSVTTYGVGYFEEDYRDIESGIYILTMQTSKPDKVILECH